MPLQHVLEHRVHCAGAAELCGCAAAPTALAAFSAVAIELVISGLAATHPGPMGELLAGESRAGKACGAIEDGCRGFARDAFLLWGDELSDFDRGYGHELLV